MGSIRHIKEETEKAVYEGHTYQEPLLKIHRELTDVERAAYFSGKYYELKDKNLQLKQENDKLKKTNQVYRAQFTTMNEEILELKKELLEYVTESDDERF